MHHVAKAPGCGHGGAARESGDGRRTGPRGGLPHSWLGTGSIGTGTKVERWEMRKGEVRLMAIEIYIHNIIYHIFL